MFLHEKQIVGFKLSKIFGFTLEVRSNRLQKSDMPELVFHSGWPTIRVPDGAMGPPAPDAWNCEIILQ